MRKCIRITIHLTIGQLAVSVDHCRCIGCTLGLFGEEVGKGLAQIHIYILACTHPNDAFCLLVAYDADTVDVGIRIGHHVLHRSLYGICHDAHLFATVHR